MCPQRRGFVHKGSYKVHINHRRNAMEKKKKKIGELVSMEIDEVKDVEYLDKEMGYMFYINLEDGRKVLLSLVDSQM